MPVVAMLTQSFAREVGWCAPASGLSEDRLMHGKSVVKASLSTMASKAVTSTTVRM